jgi:NAD(P)-dependent dehydrogenase (short-subunit alcohol dehydrogenase family)
MHGNQPVAQSLILARMVALITGGGRGIGRAIALRLAKNGFDVAIASRSPAELAATAKEAGGKTLAIAADVSHASEVKGMVQRTESELGPIELLVNNAGIAGPMGPFWETDPDEWWRCEEVNVRGPMLCSHAVLPGMMRRNAGRILNLSSGAGVRAVPNMGAYALSKAAMMRFSEQLALELAPHGIQVFAIRPGVVRTQMVEAVRSHVPVVQKFLDEGRDVPPEATADLVEYIASGKADALSGCVLSVEENWNEMVRRSEEIRRDQMCVLRLKEFPG